MSIVGEVTGAMGLLGKASGWLRDRLVMPLAAQFGGTAAQAATLQEPAATLRAIGQ